NLATHIESLMASIVYNRIVYVSSPFQRVRRSDVLHHYGYRLRWSRGPPNGSQQATRVCRWTQGARARMRSDRMSKLIASTTRPYAGSCQLTGARSRLGGGARRCPRWPDLTWNDVPTHVGTMSRDITKARRAR